MELYDRQLKYGDLPVDLGKFEIPFNENHFTLYLPIKMAGSMSIKIPEPLKVFNPLVNKTLSRILGTTINGTEWYRLVSRYDNSFSKERHDSFINRYLYLTVKHMLVHPGFWGNRGGEHADGFGTDDINWVWADKNPTEFCYADFKITPDDRTSLEEFRDQWDYKKVRTYPDCHLLEITPFVVHRVARVSRYDMRTFVKISLSKEKYNLTGNAHNHLFDYKWEMHDREAVRNMENYSNMDYVPGDVG